MTAAALMIIDLVGVGLSGRRRGWPALPPMGGMLPGSSSDGMLSWILGVVSMKAGGMPPPSVIRRRLVPSLPRSVGFGPVLSPPAYGQGCAVDAGPAPVDRACCPQPAPARDATPQPIPSGNISHWMPVRRTNRIPLSAARSGPRGVPPRGHGGTTGSSGSMINHRASETRGETTRLHESVRQAARRFGRRSEADYRNN